VTPYGQKETLKSALEFIDKALGRTPFSEFLLTPSDEIYK
jgi:hypothetical protein